MTPETKRPGAMGAPGRVLSSIIADAERRVEPSKIGVKFNPTGRGVDVTIEPLVPGEDCVRTFLTVFEARSFAGRLHRFTGWPIVDRIA
jgi:hypothetical protein